MYIDGFNDVEDIIREFRGTSAEDLEGASVLYAKYRTESYEGMAFVLYSKDNILYEVHGSHCSCNGLEECWSPEVTDKTTLEYRFFREKADFPYACEDDEDKEQLQRVLLDELVEQTLLRK